MSAGIVSASVVAGPLKATGHASPELSHQFRMGTNLFIHITPAQAAQWIAELQTIITEEKSSK